MKRKLQHISLTFLLALLAPAGFFAAHAQDAPSLVTDSYDTHPDADRVFYLPGGEAEPSGGGNAKPLPLVSKDSAAAIPQTTHRVVRTPTENLKPSQVSKQNKEEQEDESILSFNFLYYIIQKYKLQDIVD
jgi:hypothetical protein